MAKKFLLIVALVFSVTLTSCIGNKDTNDSTNDTKNENSSTVDNSSKNESNKDSKTDENTKNNTKEISFPIYSIDVNSLQPNEVKTINIDSNLDLKSKLTKIAENVSEINFDKLPIKIKSVDTIDGKKVATINLVDSDSNKWIKYFQGSTGGEMTTNTLIENFLQSNNKSNKDWIDGVKFLYNDDTIEYEHVSSLSEAHYRY